MRPAYYNENDPYAAAWLRSLIVAGQIAPGYVDERNIVDVRASDLAGYRQCHFFAGIGGWSYALRLAGWPDDRPVWTGSCPCQPFSAAGKGKAADDERHLWPQWFSLIRECAPAIIFGEQVEAAVGWGWLDAVFSDLETQGYACGAAVLPACGVGAPHIRQRLWFVADNAEPGRIARGWASEARDGGDSSRFKPGRLCDAGELAHAQRSERRSLNNPRGDEGRDGLSQRQESSGGLGSHRQDGGMGQPDRTRPFEGDEPAAPNGHRHPVVAAGWADCQWLPCTDGKARPVKSGIQPLAHGVSARVGKLRAAGNAIVPQVAAEFIIAAKEAVSA